MGAGAGPTGPGPRFGVYLEGLLPRSCVCSLHFFIELHHWRCAEGLGRRKHLPRGKVRRGLVCLEARAAAVLLVKVPRVGRVGVLAKHVLERERLGAERARLVVSDALEG